MDIKSKDEGQFEKATTAFKEFCKTISQLRDPKDGCPWDLEQDHLSLRQYMIEEAYEVVEAMSSGEPSEICDELGDVLLQIVLNSQIAMDQNDFSILNVIESINNKMKRRHPHIFATNKDEFSTDMNSLYKQWDNIKKEENKLKDPQQNTSDSIFSELKIQKISPSTTQAVSIGKKASKINFDWQTPNEVFEVLKSEIKELEEAWANGEPKNLDHLKEEIGDVYFSLAQFCRHLKIDPEVTSLDGNRKFLKRFKTVENIANKKGIQINKASNKTLLELWNEAKLLNK